MKNRSARSFVAPFLVTIAFSPTASANGKKANLPHAWAGEKAEKDGSGKCWQRWSDDCNPSMHCNPGPPHQVICPDHEKPAAQPKK